jgi:hypothetical protein
MAGQETSFFKKLTYTDGIYPVLTSKYIENPNRLYAVPVLGFLIKFIILIPVFIELMFIGIGAAVLIILVNPFVVLITGRYMSLAYQANLGMLRLSTKLSFFMFGLTDRYPGFSLDNDNPDVLVDFSMPENPGRLYAVPILGFIIRTVLMIPYFIFSQIINNAATIGVFFVASFVVLFTGKYPEGVYELARDSQRVNMASALYLSGISDRYPSFYISMAHDKIKIILIALAVIFTGFRFTNSYHDRKPYMPGSQQYRNQYMPQTPGQPSLPGDVQTQ